MIEALDAEGPEPLAPWLQPALDELLSHRDRLPHGLLVTGSRGHGHELLARELAGALLCENPGPAGHACGSCPSCRFSRLGSHPDLRVLEPVEEEDADGTSRRAEWITIKQVRGLIDFVQLTAHRQGAKVIVIGPADRLYPDAANALLKTLEEPPPSTWLMLVTSRPARLPATLRSRCRRVDCPRASTVDALRWLEARLEQPSLVLAQAGGAPLVAVQLGDPALQAERRMLYAGLAKPSLLVPPDVGTRLEQLPKHERRSRLGWLLHWLAAWSADLAAVAAGGDVRYCPDFGRDIEALSKRAPAIALQRFFRAVLADAALVSHPLSPRLVVERLLLSYRSLFA